MADAARAAMLADYSSSDPDWSDEAGRHWVMRGANFVVVTTQAKAGAVLARDGNPDEYMVLLPEGVAAGIEAGDQRIDSDGDSLSIVPPGASRVIVAAGGFVYRVFSARAVDLAARARNAGDYAAGAADVAALADWPAPVNGYRLRHYRLAEHVRSDTTMRLFRSSNLMLNVFLPRAEPRDVRKMTPHSHEDFEQASLALSGNYVHHLRYPWVPDMTGWRGDEHAEVASPSIVIIPPRVIHTSQSVGSKTSRLVDIFAPPRIDFSLKPGLVCNADDYPLPERAAAMAPVAGAA
ncbi:MAG: hypothetical protein J0H09_19455 [Burkholderiales bacterium]|nr:hypothetical protein [Burkholderiales bacterium]